MCCSRLQRSTLTFFVATTLSFYPWANAFALHCLHGKETFLSRNQNAISEGLLNRIEECNQPRRRGDLVPFSVEGKTVGYIKPEFGEELKKYKNIFEFKSQEVALSAKFNNLEDRSEAVAHVTEQLASKGLIPGWRDELYEVKNYFHSDPVLLIERAAASCFGVKGWGVHVNGYVQNNEGEKLLWVAKRSEAKINYPGMLDNIVAGGQPAGISAMENVVKECKEEANIPEILAKNAVAVSTVSYSLMRPKGLTRDTLFCYDLKLPEEFIPTANDGEVESFALYTLDEVTKIVANTKQFKPNCNLVVIDFLIRHGFITPDSQPCYEQIVSTLRNPECG